MAFSWPSHLHCTESRGHKEASWHVNMYETNYCEILLPSISLTQIFMFLQVGTNLDDMFHPEKKTPVRPGCFSAKPRVTAGNSSALSPNLAFISGPSVKEPFLSGERKKQDALGRV